MNQELINIDKKEILKLKQGKSYIIPESDYGKAEVYRINEMLILFGIPLYGGEPWYSGVYRLCAIDELLETVYGWN